jgi:hypothetical protein
VAQPINGKKVIRIAIVPFYISIAFSGSRFIKKIPASEIPTKKRLKKRCCGQVSFLITPPQEQGMNLNACNKIAAEYTVNASINNREAYNAGNLVFSNINAIAINTSIKGIPHTRKGVIQFGRGWLFISSIKSLKASHLLTLAYKKSKINKEDIISIIIFLFINQKGC